MPLQRIRTASFYQASLCLSVLLLCCSLALAGAVSADPEPQLLSAQDAIQALKDAAAKELPEETPSSEKDPRKVLQEALAQFQSQAGDMSIEVQAEQWLDLLQDYWALEPVPGENGFYGALNDPDRLGFASFLQALPVSEAWPLLLERIDIAFYDDNDSQQAMRAAALKALLAFFNGEPETAEAGLRDLEKRFSQQHPFKYQAAQEMFADLRHYLKNATRQTTPMEILAKYRRTLELHRASKSDPQTVLVPDLMNLTSPEEARSLIAQTIALSNVKIEVPAAGPTLSLLKEMLAQQIEALDRPQWHLIDHPNDWTLFEALQERFSEGPQASLKELFRDTFTDVVRRYAAQSDGPDQERLRAQQIYVIGLIVTNQVDKAVVYTLAQDARVMFASGFNALVRNANLLNSTADMYVFCGRVLEKQPDSGLWSAYTNLAILLGRTDEVLSALERRLQDNQLSPKQYFNLNELRVEIMLATDRVHQARDLMVQLTALQKPDASSAYQVQRVNHQYRWGKTLSEIGQLQNASGLLEEGLSMMHEARTAATSLPENDIDYSLREDISGIVNSLIDANRLAEAQQLLIQSLGGKIQKIESNLWETGFGYGGFGQAHLMLMAKIYNQTGQHAEVLALLETAPWWGAKDLLDIQTAELFRYAAAALRAQERVAEAVKLLEVAIHRYPSDDALYRIVLDINPTGLTDWLDNLYLRDRFEERPLIWKAQHLLESGQAAQAEAVIRQALKVDPTDGEQQAGERVRAYAVLADILKSLGKTEDAVFFENVVKSVRMAEMGDRYKRAGLLSQSLALYTQAEVLFGDAYCVQWRLAERLYELGKFEEAQAHYKIAFERMPEQFGQVASFCFGCEGVFDRQHSRSIAETVLLRLEQQEPVRPQVYFLLGQLRQSQRRYTDAYQYFQKAVQADPDYLDAWEEVYDLHEEMLLPQPQKDEIVLEMLRLDPRMKHFSADLETSVKVKEIWQVLKENQRYNVTPPATLLALTASADKIHAAQQALRKRFPEQWQHRSVYLRYDREDHLDPGQFLARHKLVVGVWQVMQMAEVRF